MDNELVLDSKDIRAVGGKISRRPGQSSYFLGLDNTEKTIKTPDELDLHEMISSSLGHLCEGSALEGLATRLDPRLHRKLHCWGLQTHCITCTVQMGNYMLFLWLFKVSVGLNYLQDFPVLFPALINKAIIRCFPLVDDEAEGMGDRLSFPAYNLFSHLIIPRELIKKPY